MSKAVEWHVRNFERFERVTDYLGASLDEPVTLNDLADLACLSRYHFERLYLQKTKETPLGTLRRLRLQRAHLALQSGNVSAETAAYDAGYGSPQAFSRAFSNEFGYPPSRIPAEIPGECLPVVRIVNVPPIELLAMNYTGPGNHEMVDAFHEMGARLAVLHTKRWRTWHIYLDGELPDGNKTIHALNCVSAKVLPDGGGLLRMTMPAGRYAAIRFRGRDLPPPLPVLSRLVLDQTGEKIVPGPVLRFNATPRGYTVPQDRIFVLYLPLF